MLHKIIRGRFHLQFQEMLSQQLNKNAGSFPLEAYGKAVRFSRLLRLRENQRLRSNSLLKDIDHAMLSQKRFVDKEHRSVLIHMACSFICTACVLFGLDINNFFPFLPMNFPTLLYEKPTSAEDNQRCSYHVTKDSVDTTETLLSIPDTNIDSFQYSSVDFDETAQEVADIKPVDDPVDAVAFSDAVLALFQLSHQSEPVVQSPIETKNKTPSPSVEDAHVSVPILGYELNPKPAEIGIDNKREEQNIKECETSDVIVIGQGNYRVDCSDAKSFDEETPLSVRRNNDDGFACSHSTPNLSEGGKLPVSGSQDFSEKIIQLMTPQAHHLDEANGDSKHSPENVELHSSPSPVLMDTDVSSISACERTLVWQSVNAPQLHTTDAERARRTFPISKPSISFQEWRSKTTFEVKPMIGWGSTVPELGINKIEWKDTRMCCLCMTCGDDDADIFIENSPCGTDVKGAGRLLPLQGSWVHAECALWSSECWKNKVTGTVYDVHKARSRGMKLKCFGCGRFGATVGCNKMHCKSNYHFSCAAACGALFTSSNKVYCSRHRDLPKESPYENFGEVMECLKVDQSDSSAEPELDSTLCHRVGALVIHSLGQIDKDIEVFHSRNHIFPEGFTSSRIFWSCVVPKTRTLYIMNVSKSTNGRALFSIRATDSRSASYKGVNVKKVYEELIQQVLNINHGYFSSGEKDSIHPIQRSPKRRAYGLNGPQVKTAIFTYN